MPLTDLQIKNLRPEPGKTARLYDQHGLYLEVSPTGRTYWRWKYRYAGKEKRLALGVYPKISLKDARLRCDEARKLLSTHVDPLRQRKKEKLLQTEQSGETFEKVGREPAPLSPAWTASPWPASWGIARPPSLPGTTCESTPRPEAVYRRFLSDFLW
jgi:hypothetical protein